jgi:hypothetical protein
VGADIFSSNFLRLKNTGIPDNFRVRVAPYVLNNGNTGDTVRNKVVQRTWFIDEDVSGGSNVRLQMYWFEGHEGIGFDRNNSRMAHYTITWEVGQPTVAAHDASEGWFSKADSGFTTFSPFTITNEVPTALPLTFLSFTAKEKAEGVALNWRTLLEVGNSHFVVEHSKDGILFEPLTTLASNGSPGAIHSYVYLHLKAPEGLNYYRIKQVDLDGSFSYSQIAVVHIRRVLQSMVVAPNPATHTLMVTLGGALPANGELQVVDLSGRVVLRHPVSRGAVQVRLNIEKLMKGHYRLLLMYEGHLNDIKFIKL